MTFHSVVPRDLNLFIIEKQNHHFNPLRDMIRVVDFQLTRFELMEVGGWQFKKQACSNQLWPCGVIKRGQVLPNLV